MHWRLMVTIGHRRGKQVVISAPAVLALCRAAKLLRCVIVASILRVIALYHVLRSPIA